MDGQTDGWTDVWIDRWTDRWIDGQTGGRTEGQMDGCGRTDGQTDGRIDPLIERMHLKTWAWVIQEATCGYRKKPKIAKSNRRNYDQRNGMQQTDETVDEIARDKKKA